MYSVVKLAPGLQIELAANRTTWRARAHVQGAVGYYNTRATTQKAATAAALVWFAVWKQTLEPKTMAAAAKIHAASYPPARAKAQADFLKRWSAISDIHNLKRMPVADIDTRYLRAFVMARGSVTGNTLKKDMDTIRPILRTALEEGWIDRLPLLPKPKVEKNPRVPFTAAEWAQLKALPMDQDLSDFMHCIVLGLLRPHEVLRLTARDVADDGNRMRIHVRRKTGIAPAPVPVRFASLKGILRRRLGAILGQNSLQSDLKLRLFPYSANWFPREFGKLLDAHGLRQPVGGSVRPRDSWSLRATGICLEIQRQRRTHGAADYLRIARWAGTSVARIDGHYAAFLN